jgi:archaellum biogenesis protein FlaJ (TadC family)
MSDAALFTNFYVSLGIAAVVVLIAAILLVLLWQAANRILTLAVTALDLVKQIRQNTMIIWALEDTNKTALNVLADAESIKAHGAAVAQALHEAEMN